MNTDLFGEYTVLHQGESVGQLTVGAAGLMTEFTCTCVCPSTQVLRLAVLTGNDRMVLGVMMPAGDKFRFQKRYSKNDLNVLHLLSIEGALLLTKEEMAAPYEAEKRPVPNAPLEEPEPETTKQEGTNDEPIQAESSESEPAEPEPTEPEPTEPEPEKPESVEPERVESEIVEPELVESEITEPEHAYQESIEPEPARIEPEQTNGAGASEPESGEPESAEQEFFPEAIRPELIESELAEPAEPAEPEPANAQRSASPGAEGDGNAKPAEPETVWSESGSAEPAPARTTGPELARPLESIRPQSVAFTTYELEMVPAGDAPSNNMCAEPKPRAEEMEDLESAWTAEPEPQRHFADRELQMVCRAVDGALSKEGRNGMTLLAVPFETGKPFPLMPIFCFGEAIRIRGENYLLFRVRDGAIVG